MSLLYKGIGISGAHRVGKSTLAKAAAEKLGMQFCETRCSEVFAKPLGGVLYKPSDDLPFLDRVAMQVRMMHHLLDRYKDMTGPFIADRTPVDVIAYMFAEVRGSSVPPDQREPVVEALNELAMHAIGICDQFMLGVIHLQPGIDLIEAEGKAKACPLYIRHINMLISSLMNGWAGTHFAAYTMPVSVLDLNQRVEHVGYFREAILSKQHAALAELQSTQTLH